MFNKQRVSRARPKSQNPQIQNKSRYLFMLIDTLTNKKLFSETLWRNSLFIYIFHDRLIWLDMSGSTLKLNCRILNLVKIGSYCSFYFIMMPKLFTKEILFYNNNEKHLLKNCILYNIRLWSMYRNIHTFVYSGLCTLLILVI